MRSGETAPDPVVALWKDGLAERIEVGNLREAEIEELLATVLDGPVDAASVRQLTRRSRGNPMVLRELVTGAREGGALAKDGGIWRLRGGLRPTARLVELVALRLGDLSQAERTVLELLTLGEPLGQAELGRLADPASVEALEGKGLITSWLDGRRVQVGLAHPIYGDVVRVGISALREQALVRSPSRTGTARLSAKSPPTSSGWARCSTPPRPAPRPPSSSAVRAGPGTPPLPSSGPRGCWNTARDPRRRRSRSSPPGCG